MRGNNAERPAAEPSAANPLREERTLKCVTIDQKVLRPFRTGSFIEENTADGRSPQCAQPFDSKAPVQGLQATFFTAAEGHAEECANKKLEKSKEICVNCS